MSALSMLRAISVVVSEGAVMKLDQNDLIVRLDEQRDVLQLLVPTNESDSGQLRVFYEIPATEVLSGESLENHIGTIILSFLSATYAAKSFRLSEYRQAGEDFEKSLSVEVDSLLSSGEADNEFEGAMLRLHRFDESWSFDDIDGITALIERAANNGSEKARDFLRDHWPARAMILKRRIGRIDLG